MGAGKIILLNGTSSSGKSSIIQELQLLLTEPYLHAGIDEFQPMWPERYKPRGDLASQGFSLQKVSDGNHTWYENRLGWYGLQVLKGMHQAIAALARAENNLLVDDVLYAPILLESYLTALNGLELVFVGVRCALEVCEARERQRGDRLIGHARGHWPYVHEHKVYDLEVDTTKTSPLECAAQIVAYLNQRKAPTAFAAMALEYRHATL